MRNVIMIMYNHSGLRNHMIKKTPLQDKDYSVGFLSHSAPVPCNLEEKRNNILGAADWTTT